MQISLNKDNLLYGTQTVHRAVSAKNPLPVLSGILLKAAGGRLTFTATDLEMGIECSVPAGVSLEGGVVVPARYFGEIVRRLPDVTIDMEVNKENNTVLIKYGQAELSLLGMSAEDFPILPSIDSESYLTIKQDLLKNMIRQVGFAVAADENRPIFTGVLMEVEGSSCRLVATDTHRLAFRQDIINSPDDSAEKAVIIPGKTLLELNRIMNNEAEEIKIAFGDNQVVFDMPGVRLVSRLIEGQFPNYKQVIPQGCNTKIRIKTKDLLDSTERASLLAREGTNVIKLEVTEGNLTINSNSPEIGRIEEQLPIELEGEETEIAFNSKYLLDVLKVIDAEDILLELSGPLSPGIIKPVESDNYLYLILPVRIL